MSNPWGPTRFTWVETSTQCPVKFVLIWGGVVLMLNLIIIIKKKKLSNPWDPTRSTWVGLAWTII